MATAINKSLLKAIAGPDSDPNFINILDVMPNPDPVLKGRADEDDVYRSISADAHVFSTILSRRAAVLSRRIELTPGGDDARAKRAVELGHQVLDRINARWFVAGCLDAPLKGRSFLEVIWQKVDGMMLPFEIKRRPLHRFAYTPEDELRVLTRAKPIFGEPVPPYRIIALRNYPSDDNPYGEAALTRCFWPAIFKKSGFKFWVIASEKYGVPWAIGKLPRGSSNKEKEELLESLEKMVADAIAVINDDGSIEVMEHKTSDTTAIHNELIGATNAEISKAVLGQTLSTEVGDVGSFAASKSHMEVRADIVEDDARLVEEAVETLLGWTTELNLGADVDSPSAELASETAPPMEWAKTIEIMRGYIQVPKTWAHERLNVPMPEKEDSEVLPAPAPVQFSQTELDPLVETDVVRLAEPADPLDPLVEPAQAEAEATMAEFHRLALEAVNGANDYQELDAVISDLYRTFPAAAVEKSLAEVGYGALAFGSIKAEANEI